MKTIDKKQSERNVRKNRIKKLLEFIKTDLKEKDEATRLALLAAVAGESIFFLGPPGTAKSMISRRLQYAFKNEDGKNLKYFEYPMNQFSTPDEVYGPVSLKSLEKDRYERIIEGYLPDADIAFLDEIWKAGPAIQNTLLTIINEKKFHNGNAVLKVPLKVLVSASNELPAENQGLEALWDRFLIRVNVKPIEDNEVFLDLVCGKMVSTELPVSDEIREAQISVSDLQNWKAGIDTVQIPPYVKNVITAIRQELTLRNSEESRDEKEKFYVSDRRWVKILQILKTSAFLNGRDKVDLMDCQIITYCIWNTENQAEEAKEIVRDCIEQNGLEMHTNIDDIEAEMKIFEDLVLEYFLTRNPEESVMQNCDFAYELVDEIEINGRYDYSTNYQSAIGHYKEKVKYIGKSGYYSSNTKKIQTLSNISNIEINGNKLTWSDSRYGQRGPYEIVMDSEYIHNQTVFGTPDLLALRQEAADKSYLKLQDSIRNELKKIKKFRKNRSAPFKSNIFADQSMCEVIISSVAKSEAQLDKMNDELENIHKKYQE